jgi:hypothetical protein
MTTQQKHCPRCDKDKPKSDFYHDYYREDTYMLQEIRQAKIEIEIKAYKEGYQQAIKDRNNKEKELQIKAYQHALELSIGSFPQKNIREAISNLKNNDNTKGNN